MANKALYIGYMAMGKRSKRERQEELWMATATIVETVGHVFYERLNEVLSEHDFDRRIERLDGPSWGDGVRQVSAMWTRL